MSDAPIPGLFTLLPLYLPHPLHLYSLVFSLSPFSSQFTLLANSLPSPAKARHLLSLTHFNLHPSLLSFTCVCSKSINSLALPVNTPFLLSILNTEMQSQPICFLEPPPHLIHLMPCPSFSILTSSSQKKTLSLCKGVRRERCLVNKLC